LQLSIIREISILSSSACKVNPPKLIKGCALKASISMVQRYLRRSGFKYKTLSFRIYLNDSQKLKRMQYIKTWISENHNWKRTIFSDEKQCSLDGPDDWRSYMQKTMTSYHLKWQCGGGAVMV